MMCRLTVPYRRLEKPQETPHLQIPADQGVSVTWCNIPEDLNLHEHRLRDRQIPRVIVLVCTFL